MRSSITMTLVSLLLFSAGAAGFAAGIISVREIEFKGLDRISKRDLIRNVKIKTAAEGISLDVGDLEKNLKENPLVASHVIDVHDGRLVITIAEKRLLFPVVVKGKRESFLYELDGRYQRVSTNRLYSRDTPVIVVESRLIGKKGMGGFFKKIVEALNRLKNEKKAFFDQIGEVMLNMNGTADVLMKGRRTRFTIDPGYRGFAMIGYITAYLDRINYYPGKMRVQGDKAFFKPGNNK